MQPISKFLLAATLAAGLFASSACAVTVSITPVVSAAYSDNTFATEILIPALNPADGMPHHLRVDFNVAISNLSASQRAFGYTLFDIKLGSGLTDAFGWAPNLELVALPPSGPGGDQFLFRLNLDTVAADLKGIGVGVIQNPPASDARGNVGKPGFPRLLGQLYVNWNGFFQTSITADVRNLGIIDAASGNLIDVSKTATLLDEVLPLGIGEASLIPVNTDLGSRTPIQGIINHLFKVSSSAGAVAWSNLQVVGPNPGNNPMLDAQGNFSWDPIHAALGDYKFNATVTDQFGSAIGMLNVRIIPEPATMSLLGFAMTGLFAFIRRRWTAQTACA